MPADVFLVLASSGIAFVASLMFLVSDDPPRRELDDPRAWTSFSLPPLRTWPTPPPLPARAQRSDQVFGLATAHGGTRFSLHLSFQPESAGWVVDLECEPLADSPAVCIEDSPGAGPVPGTGQVHDLRWHGRAGIARRSRARWSKPPADA